MGVEATLNGLAISVTTSIAFTATEAKTTEKTTGAMTLAGEFLFLKETLILLKLSDLLEILHKLLQRTFTM